MALPGRAPGAGRRRAFPRRPDGEEFMRRRFYALLAAASLAVSVLGGCETVGTAASGSGQTPAAVQEQEGAAVTAEAAETSEAAETAETAEAAETEAVQSPSSTAGTYPVQMLKKVGADPVTGEIGLVFSEGTDIPYVSLSEYMPFLASVYEDEKAPVFKIEKAIDRCFVVSRTDNGSDMAVSTGDNTIEFLDYDRFISPSAPNVPAVTGHMVLDQTGSDGAGALLQDTGESYDRRGGKVLKIDLTAYGISVMEEGGECYVPLQTLNDLLLPQTGKAAIFNGQELLVGPWGGDFLKGRYSVPQGPMSEAMADFNYRELCLSLDTFYGLKTEHGIIRFGDFFNETGLTEDLSGTDPAAFDRGLRRLVLKYFHDSCSGFRTTSVLTGRELEADNGLGVLSDPNARTGQDMTYVNARKKYYPGMGEKGRVLRYEETEDTAIITFDSFTADREDYYTQADRANPGDTVEMISHAQARITREGSPVRNLVLDLSCCRGGSVDAAVFTAAWLRGSALIGVRNILTGALSAEGVRADVNLDGVFDQKDLLPSYVHVYVLTSRNTFSCASLVAAAVKGKAGITLLGAPTGGGGSLDRLCTTASGAEYRIPGTLQTGVFIEGAFYRPEGGTEPDFVISNVDTFYNRTLLTEFIKSLP